MGELVLSAVVAGLGIWAAYLNRKKAVIDVKIEKAMELTAKTLQTDFRLRTHLMNGDHAKLQQDLDRIASDLRALRLMLGK